MENRTASVSRAEISILQNEITIVNVVYIIDPTPRRAGRGFSYSSLYFCVRGERKKTSKGQKPRELVGGSHVCAGTGGTKMRPAEC